MRRGEGMVFANIDEVNRAYESRVVELHAKIKVRIDETNIDDVTRRAHRKARNRRHDDRPCTAVRHPAGRPAVRPGQHGADQEEHLAPDQRLLSPARPEGNGRVRRQAHVHGLPLRDARRHFDRHRRHEDSGRQEGHSRSCRKGSGRDPGAVPVGSGHRRRALQQGCRYLVSHQRTGRQGHDGRHRQRQGQDGQG